jgi:putative acetyltransferase
LSRWAFQQLTGNFRLTAHGAYVSIGNENSLIIYNTVLQRCDITEDQANGKPATVKDFQRAVAQLREASRQAVRELGFLEYRYRKTGCTHSQCHTLVEMDARRRVTVGELAGIFSQDISSTSRTMRTLIDRGFVEALADSQDGRRRPFRLTPEGRAKVREIHSVANDQAQAALKLLNPTDQDIVVRGMSLYAQALERSNKLASVEIRLIVPGDDEAMSAIIRQIMTEFGAVGNGMSIGDTEVDRMSAAYQGERSVFFVAVKGVALQGGAGICHLVGCDDADVCELRKMYVLPQGRGIGLGRKLMDRCLDAARDMGYRRIYLETLDNMIHARHLFDKYGFRYLEAPMGETGHHGCTKWAIRDL